MYHTRGGSETRPDATNAQELSKQVIREVVIPEIEKEVNQGQNFAPLRQMFYAMILASWYKLALKDALLNQVYSNKGKTSGVLSDDPAVKEKIYDQYLQAYKKGVFNYIKDDMDAVSQQPMPRKYFSGGEVFPVLREIERVTTTTPRERAGMQSGVLSVVMVRIARAIFPNGKAIEKQPGVSEEVLSAEKELVAALKNGARVEAQGAGSRIIFGLTDQVEAAFRKVLGILNPGQAWAEGKLKPREIAAIRTKIGKVFGPAVALADDGKSITINQPDISVEEANQLIDAAMSADNIQRMLTMPMITAGVIFLFNIFAHSTQVSLDISVVSLVIAVGTFLAFSLSLSPYREYIKKHREITEEIGRNVITLLRPKEAPIMDKEWERMGDDLVKALKLTGYSQILRDSNYIRIETKMSKADIEQKIKDMSMAQQVKPGVSEEFKQAGRALFTALQGSVTYEPKQDGKATEVTVHFTDRVRKAISGLWAVAYPEQSLSDGEPSAEELVKIKEIAQSFFAPHEVEVAKDRVSFVAPLSMAETMEVIDGAMSSDNIMRVLIAFFVASAFGLLASNSFVHNEMLDRVSSIAFVITLLLSGAFYISLNPYLNYIKKHYGIIVKDQEIVITLPKPKVPPITDREWGRIEDDLVSALKLKVMPTVIRNDEELRIVTGELSKAEAGDRIKDMSMAQQVDQQVIGMLKGMTDGQDVEASLKAIEGVVAVRPLTLDTGTRDLLAAPGVFIVNEQGEKTSFDGVKNSWQGSIDKILAVDSVSGISGYVIVREGHATFPADWAMSVKDALQVIKDAQIMELPKDTSTKEYEHRLGLVLFSRNPGNQQDNTDAKVKEFRRLIGEDGNDSSISEQDGKFVIIIGSVNYKQIALEMAQQIKARLWVQAKIRVGKERRVLIPLFGGGEGNFGVQEVLQRLQELESQSQNGDSLNTHYNDLLACIMTLLQRYLPEANITPNEDYIVWHVGNVDKFRKKIDELMQFIKSTVHENTEMKQDRLVVKTESRVVFQGEPDYVKNNFELSELINWLPTPFSFEDGWVKGGGTFESLLRPYADMLLNNKGILFDEGDILRAPNGDWHVRKSEVFLRWWNEITWQVQAMERGLARNDTHPTNEVAEQQDNAALPPGGIDLNARNMGLEVARDGKGVDMKFDPAMVAEFQKGDFTGVEGIILRIVPLQSPFQVLGMEASPAHNELAQG